VDDNDVQINFAAPAVRLTDQTMFERRFWAQVEKLVEFGIAQADAEEIVDTVRPTGGAHGSHASPVIGNDPPKFAK
jgi:hypothetical protein